MKRLLRNLITGAIVLLAGTLLSACETTAPWSEQDWAGITTIEVSGNGIVPDTLYKSGKESGGFKVVYHGSPDGTIDVELEARDVRAFDGQALRAEVSKALAEAQIEIAPDALTAIIDGVKLFMGVP